LRPGGETISHNGIMLMLEQKHQSRPNTQPKSKMASNRSEEKDFIHYKVLKFLKDNPDMSQRELAQHLGISNGGMHYCLNALMDKGLIRLSNFANSKHKLRYYYLLTPKGITKKAAMTKRFLAHKMAEYESLKAEIAELKEDVEAGKVVQVGKAS
jgi:EPS-associated MarR family transcriptional regulator